MAFAGTVYFLAGDSYPGDAAEEQAACTRLRTALPRILTQPEWQGSAPLANPAARRDRLAEVIGATEDAVLIGRSSGGRVAAMLATTKPVHAVICLAYPFQAPNRVVEHERVAPLAQLTVPTLILQGTLDEYCGLEVTERFALSPAVRLRLLPGVDHTFRLSPQGWDRVAAIMLGFIGASTRPAAPNAEDFDEADYLRRYPDVAGAVARGLILSGHAHYLGNGRREARRYRLRPLDGTYSP